MPRYVILANPGHNRVYFNAAAGLSLAELEIVAGSLAADVSALAGEVIGGIPYIAFTAGKPLDDAAVRILSALSFAYALFRVEGEGSSRCLYPLELAESPYFSSGISTILKYTGKTNELFTRMMINLALHSGDFARAGRVSLLDPVAGKGTTLFEGLRLGLDVTGIEIGGKAVQESCAYFKKYLETEKYKHTFTKEKKSGANKAFTAHLYSYAFAKTKEDFKNPQHLTMAEGNARHADKLFGKNAFQVLVGDLPYGVAHGNVTSEKTSSLTRNPTELLEACLPAWHAVLSPGGVMVLAWNLHVLPREKMLAILTKNGFAPFIGGAYDRLAHRVDRAILRDVVVAAKRS